MGFRDYLNEAKTSKLVNLATASGKDAALTDELREEVKKYFKIDDVDMPPKINAGSITTFVKEYNSLLKKYGKAMTKIFDYNVNVGRGELLVACLQDNIKIGGTGQNYDVDFGKEKVEVKEAKVSGGKAGNFRLGVDSSEYLDTAFKQLVELYGIARNYIPEIDNEAFSDNVYKKGGIALSSLRDWKMPKNVELKSIDVTVDNKGFVKNKSDILGNINDKNIADKIMKLLKTPKNVKTFDEIERELESKVSNSGMGYWLFDSGTQELYYKKSLYPIRIESATQRKVKFQVIL